MEKTSMPDGIEGLLHVKGQKDSTVLFREGFNYEIVDEGKLVGAGMIFTEAVLFWDNEVVGVEVLEQTDLYNFFKDF